MLSSKLNCSTLKASKTIGLLLFKTSNLLGRDISRDLDRTILRRVIKKGDVYEMPNEDATIEIKIKGSYKGEVYDDRTVTYIGGAGIVDDIPYGYVFNFLK